MRSRSSLILVAALLASGTLSCAHQSAGAPAGYGALLPLGSVNCLGVYDIYTSRHLYSSGAYLGSYPCYGFVSGDYEQYPQFTPVSARQVTLTADRERSTRVVVRPDFSSAGGSSAGGTATGGTVPISAPAASVPRMAPAPIASSPPPPTTVGRSD